MTDQSPQVVAAASLSPVSPRPLHNTYTLPQVLPDLQHQAENPDVVPLEPTTFRTAEAAMAPEPAPTQPTEPGQDAMACSDSDLASIADDDSFQYDGEGDGDNGQAHETMREVVQEGDDYAMTFDSPMEKEQEQQEGADEIQQQQPEEAGSTATESMIIPEQHVQPDPVDPQAPSLSEQGSQSDPAATSTSTDAAIFQPSESGARAPTQEALPTTAQPAIQAIKPEEAVPKESDVQPKPEDVEMSAGDASDATPLDIQKLVDQITAQNEGNDQAIEQQANKAISIQTAASADVDVSSLPPKPALTQAQSKQTFSPATYHHASLPNAPNFPTGKPASLPSQPPQLAFANNAGAQTMNLAQPHPYQAAPAFSPFPSAYPPGNSQQQAPGFHGGSGARLQTYDEFLADERKAMADAKWERFPDGSRIFIGNLSQERVSKKDVFELFHVHGRLAQISLKSAYGFVQYHTTAEAQSAMNGLQGAEVKGRKINLEISRTQKTKKDRDHSPERRNRGDRGERGERGERGGRTGDRYDGGRRRDDFRGARSPSPRRDEGHRGRQDSYSRGQHDRFNPKRSRSPDHRRHDSYRRRSPSPNRRSRQEPAGDQLEIPRRYGSDVPDVQILMMQDVHKDFVDWVQRAFHEQGLRPDAMFLNPRFPREAVIQRQVLEGVHGVVELDMRAQNTAKISLQVFDRSAGNNVRFDQYQELDPPVAAQLVLRTKGSVAQQHPVPAYAPQPSFPAQPYGAPTQYGGYAQAPVQQPPPATPDLTALVTQLSQMPNIDNASMQTILASIQQQQAPAHTPINYAAYAGPPQTGGNQLDINALINNISAASANNGPPGIRSGGMAGYPQPGYPQANQGAPQPVVGSSDPARDVQNIMATLAMFRQ